MIISHEYKFIYIGIPRTGTFTVRYVLDALMPHSLMPLDQDFTLPMGDEKRVDHATAVELRAHLGEDVWQTYLKFAFVRNPWDRVASWYHSNFFKKKNETFANWLIAGGLDSPDYPINHVAPAAHWITGKNGDLDIDIVARFENFETDLISVLKRVGIESKNIPHINASKRPDYRELYTEQTRAIVAEYFKDDIQLFNYKF